MRALLSLAAALGLAACCTSAPAGTSGGTTGAPGGCDNQGCTTDVDCCPGYVCFGYLCYYGSAPGTSGGGSSTGGSTGRGTTTGGHGGTSGGLALPDGGWPKWHYDATCQGQSPADTSRNQGALAWRFYVGQLDAGLVAADPNPTYMNSPVVDGAGNVYELGMDGTFWSVGPDGGARWKKTLLPPYPDEHPGTPTLAADGTLFVESGCDGQVAGQVGLLYHLDAATGQLVSSVAPPNVQSCYAGPCYGPDGFDVGPTLGHDDLLFDGDDFGQIATYAAGVADNLVSRQTAILPFFGERVSVVLDQNDRSYWCSLGSCFGVSSPEQGFQPLSGWPDGGAKIGTLASQAPWSSGWTNSDLAYDENHTGWLIVEAGTQSADAGVTEVVAMDPADGSLHWDVQLPAGRTPGYFPGVSLSGLGIFSADTGNSAPAVSTFPGQPNDGLAYVGNVDGLHALDVHTGKEAAGFPFATAADVDTAPALGADGTIFFGCADGAFYALAPDGGTRWAFDAGARISSSPAIGPDGTVYFVSDDGWLYALH